MKRIGVLYHPRVPAAEALAHDMAESLPSMGATAWLCSAWEEDRVRAQAEGTDLALSVGGDGTILRSARAVAPHGVPLVGINLGRLGFLTELSPVDAKEKLPELLAGAGWIEERAMLQARPLTGKETSPFHALNDVVVARGSMARAVYVTALVGGETLATYKGDGVIVSAATGSTGYSLAMGGPVLHPQSREIMLTPIAVHLALPNSIVLPSTTELELRVNTDHQAILSVDGQIELELRSNDGVSVELSPYLTRFLRLRGQNYFFATLTQRLRNREGEPRIAQ
ncbi:MAG: NAD(+)/NADH kinase [Chloroflexota bacterium]